MFITAVCVIFLIKLRWPKNKSLYDNGVKLRIRPQVRIADLFFVCFAQNES